MTKTLKNEAPRSPRTGLKLLLVIVLTVASWELLGETHWQDLRLKWLNDVYHKVVTGGCSFDAEEAYGIGEIWDRHPLDKLLNHIESKTRSPTMMSLMHNMVHDPFAITEQGRGHLKRQLRYMIYLCSKHSQLATKISEEQLSK